MSAQPKAGLKDPQEFYLDWEHAHWAAQDIDLSRDPDDWNGLEDGERELLYLALSSLMVAEERISTQFCGLVLAQDDEEEGSYLSTQLVDEVRHMQFYKRFQDDVIADPATIADHVARSRGFSANRSRRSSTMPWSRPTIGSSTTLETGRQKWTS
jgi:ribonucleoside-diphosphate reductase beta chain